MKKKIAVGAVLIALLLVGGGLWYTRPVGFSAVFPGFQRDQVTSCSAVLLPTYTNDAIQNVEIAPGSPDYQQLLELLNGEIYSRQIGFVSDVQRITLEPHYAHLSLRQGEDLLTLTFYGPQVVAEVNTPAGSRNLALHPQGGEEFQASVVELIASLASDTEA